MESGSGILYSPLRILLRVLRVFAVNVPVLWLLRSAWGLWISVVAAIACLVERQRTTTNHGEWHQELSAASLAGRLTARPGRPAGTAPRGLQRLGECFPCGGMLYVPPGYRADHPAPFLLMLHGASGVGLFSLWPILRFANAAGLIVLAPDSRGRTWDRVRGAFGPDVSFIDRALAEVFRRYAVDPGRLAIGGFSDGASEALSLGLSNGDVFTNIIAFSPGFMAPAREEGRPRIFVSHGTEDRVLPVACAQRIVSRLRQTGYDVTYRQFVGPHIVPGWIARESVAWLRRSRAEGRTV